MYRASIEKDRAKRRYDVRMKAHAKTCAELGYECNSHGQVNRYRKHKSFGCGRAKCQVCHGYKFPKRVPTRKERYETGTESD